MGILDGSPGEAPRMGSFDEITVDECWRLLASKPVGRVGYTGSRGPQVLPVNHVVHDGTIVFRCAAYSGLARDVQGARVAFQVDQVDDASRTGWSVLVVGSAELVHDPDELVELWTGGAAHPWAPGTRTVYVRITAREVTGRQVTAT